MGCIARPQETSLKAFVDKKFFDPKVK